MTTKSRLILTSHGIEVEGGPEAWNRSTTAALALFNLLVDRTDFGATLFGGGDDQLADIVWRWVVENSRADTEFVGFERIGVDPALLLAALAQRAA